MIDLLLTASPTEVLAISVFLFLQIGLTRPGYASGTRTFYTMHGWTWFGTIWRTTTGLGSRVRRIIEQGGALGRLRRREAAHPRFTASGTAGISGAQRWVSGTRRQSP